jgi:post-segregation antitoxin (ccd killing protein)
MKTKLTITIDRELVPRAKKFARSRGVSLSQLIEDALQAASSVERTPFSRRWRGKFEPAEQGDARYRALSKKYA